MDFNSPSFKLNLNSLLGNKIGTINAEPVGGGCINDAFKLSTQSGVFFVKRNAAERIEMFEKEQRGLEAMRKTQTIPIARPIGTFVDNESAFLLMDWVDTAPKRPKFWSEFGESLAALHQTRYASYGWEEDNYIGSLVQPNDFASSFVDFFASQRLLPMLKLAMDADLVDNDFSKRCYQLIERLPKLIPEAAPSLLHGDLWSGNFLVGDKGQAVLIDPAVYYGHHEAELAFTRLFGGFDQEFYDGYAAVYPMQEGWKERIDLFNLYPLMVHLNLFGQSYLPEIHRTMVKFT